MKTIRTSLIKKILLLLFFFSLNISAQLSAPNVEAVYGGRINAITGYELTSDTSRIFISTESANSVFYADIYSNTTSPVYGSFSVMPGLDAPAGYGDRIQMMAAHKNSGFLFFGHQTGLLSSHPSSSTVNSIWTPMVNSILIKGDVLLFTESGNLRWGSLDSSGNFTEDTGSPIPISGLGGMNTILIHPITDTVYVFSEGSSPDLLKLNDTYLSLSSTTTYADISPTGLTSGVQWTGCGIAPDSKIYLIGSDGNQKFSAESSDEISWSSATTGIMGVSGRNIDFAGSSSSYHIYTSSMYNNNSGMSGFWQNFGNPGGLETHANDGAVYSDPINSNIVYMTTDQGIGASEDNGATIFEIDDGVEAVQVNDFSQTTSKYTAWIAAKSGIRRVDDYLVSPSWTNAIFPNGDGSPYYSVEMSTGDSTTVYVGNVRIYKSTDNGLSWNQVFTPENSPYNLSNVGTKALAISECPFDNSLIMAGFEVWNSDKGGLFVSYDSGNNWDQILLEASSVGQDVDVSDIIFTIEGSDTVAYVSALYDLSAPQGRSVYKLVKSGNSFSVSQDMNSGTTSTGSLIVATIWDLEVSTTGDTIYAAGTDAGVNHPISYYKDLAGSNLWTPMPTSGFPFVSGKEATAITIGIDTVYAAVDEEIYYFDLAGSAWQLGYTYPTGTRINFLFYDELLAGTSFGLYGHTGGTAVGIKDENNLKPTKMSLKQNYPNPFNPSTKIEYIVDELSAGIIKLEIFNLLGQKIKTLVNSKHQPGKYEVVFNAESLTSGIYFYRLISGNNIFSKKMILLK